MPPVPGVERRRRCARPAARRGALRVERALVARLLVHDAARHGALPRALVRLPRLAGGAVGAGAGGLAGGSQRGAPRSAGRRLRRDRPGVDRLLLREPPHLVREPRAAGGGPAAALRRAAGRGEPRRGAAHRGDRRGREARARARGDDGGREAARLHLARRRTGTRGSRACARPWRTRPRATAPPIPRARAPACATPPSIATRRSRARRSPGYGSPRPRSRECGRASSRSSPARSSCAHSAPRGMPFPGAR